MNWQSETSLIPPMTLRCRQWLPELLSTKSMWDEWWAIPLTPINQGESLHKSTLNYALGSRRLEPTKWGVTSLRLASTP